MDNKSYAEQVREKISVSENVGKWGYTSEGGLLYSVNGVSLEESDIPENLVEEFRNKDKDFPAHLKAYYNNLNNKNLSPEVSQDAEHFFASAVERYRDVLSCASFYDADAIGKGNDFTNLRCVLGSSGNLSDFYHIYKRFSSPENKDDEKIEKLYKFLAIDPKACEGVDGEPVYNDYILLKLCEKYNVRLDAHFYVRICNDELNKKNPYPNFGLVKKMCDALVTETPLNSHAAKHMFTGNEGNAGSLLDRAETLPLAAQVFERSAQAYTRNEGYASAEFPIIIDPYLQYKAIMLQQNENFDDLEAMKTPEIQKLINNHLEKGPKYVYNELNKLIMSKREKDDVKGYWVAGHFVDVDGTLIQNGKLNKTLYEDMLKARSLGEPVYIFSGAQKETQVARLKALGVDVQKIPFIDKKELKNCIIWGTVVDDTPPYLQGFCTKEGYTLKPNQENYEFKMSGKGGKTVPELMALRHPLEIDKIKQNIPENSDN